MFMAQTYKIFVLLIHVVFPDLFDQKGLQGAPPSQEDPGARDHSGGAD